MSCFSRAFALKAEVTPPTFGMTKDSGGAGMRGSEFADGSGS